MHNSTNSSRALLLTAITLVFLFSWGTLSANSEQGMVITLVLMLLVLALSRKLKIASKLEVSAGTHHWLLAFGSISGTLVLIAALYDNHFALLLLCTVLLYSVVGFGLTIQFGYCGIFNFAGAAFFGTGCYTAAVLATHTAIPHLLVVVCGGLVAAALGSVLILPVLRTRGHYAALVTIAFAFLFNKFMEVNDVLGGAQGLMIPPMTIFGWEMNSPVVIGDIHLSFYVNYAVLSLVLCVLAFVFVRTLERSWIGLSMDIVRTDEVAASVFGIPIARIKILAFVLGNILIGMAGAVYGLLTSYVAANNFTFADSLILVSIVLLGGIGNLWGIIPAAVIILILPEKLQFIQEYRFLLYGVLIIAILLFRPDGLLSRTTRKYVLKQVKV